MSGITAPGNFTFSRAVREWCFVQLPLIELAALRTALKARGLSDFGLFARDPWETLDREGVVVPVAYARHGFWQHELLACLEDGDLRVREESGHVPWGELRTEADEIHGDNANVQVLYHHWQILAVAELQDWLTPRAPWGTLGDGLEAFSRCEHGSPPLPKLRHELTCMHTPQTPAPANWYWSAYKTCCGHWNVATQGAVDGVVAL